MKKLQKFIISSFLILSILSGCNNSSNSNNSSLSNGEITSTSDTQSTTQLKKFTNIIFSTQKFDYDGKEHSLIAENVPSFANVKYTNNNQVNAGTYSVKVSIEAEGYEMLSLSALLIINPLEFSNIFFSGDSFDYDGEFHSIYAENVPSFAQINYSNNKQKDPGVYTVEATISAPNYKTLTLQAELTIVGHVFTGISFEDQEFEWDDEFHSLKVSGAPDFATIKYSDNNKQYNPGTYIITATITAEGYEKLQLKATMKIVKKLPTPILPNRTLIYNGKDQLITFSIPHGNLKNAVYNSIDIELKVDNKTISDINEFRVKTIGKHKVSIRLQNSYYDYEPSYIEAIVTVLPLGDIAGIDETKLDFKFTDTLTFQELRSEILKGNFTVEQQVADQYFYPDGSTSLSYGSLKTSYVCNNEMFSFNDNKIIAQQNNYYPETSYEHAKMIDDYVYYAEYNAGIIDDFYSKKYSASLFAENIISKYGLCAMQYLKEGPGGEIVNGSEANNPTIYATFEIDKDLNTFTMETRRHYFHPEYNHDEIVYYTLYNVGNTLLHIPESLEFTQEELNLFDQNISCYLANGFELNANTLDVTFDSLDSIFVNKGEYIIPATNGEYVISSFTQSRFQTDFQIDLTGYIFKTYFDSLGNYQGEYKDYGYVKKYSLIENLEYIGATILFYGEW